jgi:TetR/AcrR family transcriptional regulator, transcriptional repressor for nem operon
MIGMTIRMDTRTALLNCAEDAVRARGFDGFSYADLSLVVGIRKASIHHHFATKADLALALIERYSDNFFGTLDQIALAHDTGGARLGAYVAACRTALGSGDRLCLCVALIAGRDGLSAAVRGRLDLFHDTVTAWLSAVFALGAVDGTIAAVTDPAADAHACLAQMEGAQLIARAAGDITRFDAAVKALLARAG